jgi:hypothetical protein
VVLDGIGGDRSSLEKTTLLRISSTYRRGGPRAKSLTLERTRTDGASAGPGEGVGSDVAGNDKATLGNSKVVNQSSVFVVADPERTRRGKDTSLTFKLARKGREQPASTGNSGKLNGI